MQQVFSYVGQFLLAAGGGAAVAIGVFRFLGQSWIEHQFKERLEAFKHEKAVEVARLRVEIESTLGGAMKFQQLEFDLLPHGWNLLEEAYGLARWIAGPFQEYSSVERIGTNDLDEVLRSALPDLSATQREELINLQANERQRRYQKHVDWHNTNRAIKAANELARFASAKGLFLPKALKEKFREIVQIIRQALISVQSSIQFDKYEFRERASNELAAVEQLYKDIEETIELRLRSHSQAPEARQ